MGGKRGTAEERFWRYVNPGGEVECWPWTGSALKLGYGSLTTGPTTRVLAHRLAWEIANGPIPVGAHVLHRCDNPPCCNPAHLFLGTHADNMADKRAKGRANPPRGVATASCKLTEAQVREMRALRAAGHSLRDIASRYGVSYPTARSVVLRLKWKHVA